MTRGFAIAGLALGLVVLSVLSFLLPAQVRPTGPSTPASVTAPAYASGQVTLVGTFHWGVEGGGRRLGIPTRLFPYITANGKNYGLMMAAQNPHPIGMNGGSFRDGQRVKVTGWLQIWPSTNTLGEIKFEGTIVVTTIQPA